MTKQIDPSTSGIWQQHATRAFFFIAGFGIAAWAPLVPFIKVRLGIAEDTLGLLLLCIGLGSVITMPLAGALAARFGCRTVITATALALPLLLLLLSFLSSLPLLIITLLLFGAAVGSLDVVVNIHAVIVEKASGQRLMSGLHGLWSVGGFAGAGLFGVLMKLGLSPVQTILCIAFIILVTLLLFYRHLLPYGGKGGGSPFTLPKGIVAIIGGLCFISFLAEGAVLDWSGVFLTSLRGLDMSMAGLGYAVFSIAMLLGRLSGDWIVQKLGDRQVVIGGAIIAASGFVLTMLIEDSNIALFGFFLIGAGASNIVPVLFSLLGTQTVMPVNAAVSAVTTIGYSGILMGPAAIGFIAHQTGLVAAFGMLASLLFMQAFVARRIYANIKK